jgi:hypothetical protein
MPFKPDPEFWKKVGYSNEWAQHVEKVNKVESEILQRFPKDKFPELEIEFGFGAKTAEWIKGSPSQKGEPDIELSYNSEKVCDIEVSGSPKVNVPPNNIWIRPDKFNAAKPKDYETWFYMEYRNNTWVLDRGIIAPYENNVVRPRIKYHPETGEKVEEKYIEIPYRDALPKNSMFDWIAERIKQLMS